MRDINFRPAKNNLSAAYLHILFWFLFIVYEITLAAAIRERFNHPADYFSHYSLNILLFYFHCYLVLGNKQLNKIKDYHVTFLYLVLEICLYYYFSLGINKLLISFEIPVNVVDTSSRLFRLSILYRFIYMIGLASAFRVILNLIENRERIHNYTTQNLVIEKEKVALRTELIKAELSLLRSQVNPHFLFNSLNSVYNRVRKNDPNSAEYVMALADLMRYALQPQSATDEVPVQSELEHISNYLKLQRMRYSADLELNISIDEPDNRIAPLLLITIVENVFQHGELHNPTCRPLIEIIVADGEIVLQTKNLIRPDHRPGNGLGLTNIRKRLEYQYKDRFEFEYCADGKIFNVKLLIKLK